MMQQLPMPAFGVELKGKIPTPDLAKARADLEVVMRSVGTMIQQAWIRTATKRRINRTGAYLAGVTRQDAIQITMHGDVTSFSGVVTVTNNAPHARIVEDGHSAFHLPSRINWGGAKVKTGKTGRKYMHIPFRHYTPASAAETKAKGLSDHTVKHMMPSEVYAQAKQLTASARLLQGPQHNPQGQYIAADKYKWGERLQGMQRAGFAQDAHSGELYESQRSSRTVPNVRMNDGTTQTRTNPGWQAPKHEGMFRTKRNGGGSRYFTIRTITQDSTGWNIPALVGKHVAADVATTLRTPKGMELLRKRMVDAVKRNMQ